MCEGRLKTDGQNRRDARMKLSRKQIARLERSLCEARLKATDMVA